MLYVIRWEVTPATSEQPAYVRGPFLVEREGNKLWWLHGGYMSWPENAEILAEYDYDNDHIEDAEIRFYREFHLPITALKLSEGWLSPEGEFYPCDYGEHEGLATRITAVRYGALTGAEALRRQWIKVQQYWYREPDGHITDAQRETAFQLAELASVEEKYLGQELFLKLAKSEEYEDLSNLVVIEPRPLKY